MDTTRDIIFRDFLLNDADIRDAITGGGGTGTGISGCVVDRVDFSDADVVQFMEKRSQADGMDVGEPFLGARRTRMSGTLYGTSRALLYDSVLDLRAALSPVLAHREEPGDKGYRPLYFSMPTNRLEDFIDGVIPMRLLALPRGFSCVFDRDQVGGEDDDALAIPWQATFISRDPTLQGATPQDYAITAQTLVTGAGAGSGSDTIDQTAHGLVAGDRVTVVAKTGANGIMLGVAYYVIASGLTANNFKVSLTLGGSAVDITSTGSNMSYVKSATTAGNVSHRGNYITAVNMLLVVGAASGSVSATIGDSTMTITIPASTGERTFRLSGEDKVLTVEEDDTEVLRMDLINFDNETTWPLVDPGTSAYSITVHGGVTVAGSHFWFYERYA